VATFRFGLQVSHAASPRAWKELARKAEDFGFATLYMPDHLGEQWAPLAALAVAAEVTSTLRVGTLVLDNDFRHPVVLAKEAATLDVLTGGRFELGLGAGWMRADYEQSGLVMDSAGVRVARLEESLRVLRALWSGDEVDFAGEHYTLRGARNTPAPVTPGGPPLLIGGGSRRILELAGRYADTVSVVPSLAAGTLGAEVAAESVVEKYRDRVAWARQAAGPRADALEMQCWTAAVQVVPNADEVIDALAPAFGLTAEQLRAAPIALIGTVKEIIESLHERRETLGFTGIVVHEADMDALQPVLAELAGS
jgi:probable F420-dependent oxidoreductase